MVNIFFLILVEVALVRQMETSFAEIISGEDFILQKDPKQYVDLGSETTNPGFRLERGRIRGLGQHQNHRIHRITTRGSSRPNDYVFKERVNQDRIKHNHNRVEGWVYGA